MLKVFKLWSDRYFGDEEAVILALLLAGSLTLVLTMGSILAPVIASIIIAFLMQGMVSRFRIWGLSHRFAVSLTTLILMSALVGALLFLLPVIWQQLVRLFAEVPGMLIEWQRLLLRLPEQYPQLVSSAQVEELIALAGSELGQLGQGVLSFSVSNLPILLSGLIYLVVVPILVFFFLKDSETILQWVGSFLPSKRPRMQQIWLEMNAQVASYVRGKVIEILVVGGASYFTFLLLGLNYALLLGVAVGLSVLIPYIGAMVVTLPVVMIAFLQWGIGADFYWVFFTYCFIQALDGNLLVPLLFSEAVNLHPVAIIVAVLFFGGLWGFWGVFFAIPLATLLKAIYSAWHQGMDGSADNVPVDSVGV